MWPLQKMLNWELARRRYEQKRTPFRAYLGGQWCPKVVLLIWLDQLEVRPAVDPVDSSSRWDALQTCRQIEEL